MRGTVPTLVCLLLGVVGCGGTEVLAARPCAGTARRTGGELSSPVSRYPADGVSTADRLPAQEASNRTRPLQLEPVFLDSFEADTRGDYKISGMVGWERGSLQLADGATLERRIGGDAWANVEFDLEVPPRSREATRSEIRVWFVLDGATSCFVRLRNEVTDGQAVTAVALIDTSEENGNLTEQVVRETRLPGTPDRVTKIEYRHGLVRVTFSDQTTFSAYITNGSATVQATVLQTVSGALALSRFAANAVRVRPVTLTDEQTRQLEEAEAANSEMFRLAREGKYAAAARVGESVLEIRKLVLGEQHADYATSLNNLAVTFTNMSDYARAAPILERATAIRRSVIGEQHPNYAQGLNNLGALYSRMGDPDRAEPLYQRALEIRRRVFGEQHSLYALSLNNLALLYDKTGDFARSEQLYREALEVIAAVDGKRHTTYARGLNNLGALYNRMGQYARAEKLYREASELWKSLHGRLHPNYATSLNNLAFVYSDMEDYARAEPLYREAIEITEVVSGDRHPDYAARLNNLAMLYQHTGEFARALPLFERALEIQKAVLGEHHFSYATSLNNLALLYRGIGDRTSAATLHTRAVDIIRDELAANSLVQSERQQKRNQSVQRFFLDNRLSLVADRDDGTDGLARLLWQWKGVITSRRRAYRQVARDARLSPLFDELQMVAQQLSATTSRVPIPPVPAATKATQEAYRRSRSAWEQQLADLNQRRESLEQQIAAGSDEFRRSREPLTVDVVQSSLPRGTALIDFLEFRCGTPDRSKPGASNYEMRLIAFVVRPDRVTTPVMLGATDVLDKAVATFRAPFSQESVSGERASGGAAERAAAELRDRLWLPLEKHLDGIETVIISPDTFLGTLPFCALPGARPGSYLIEEYRFASLPQAAMLRAWSDQHDTGGSAKLLAIGDVAYGAPSGHERQLDDRRRVAHRAPSRGGGWVKLPAADEELAGVSRLFRERFASGTITPLTGTAATEVDFMAQAKGHSHLHLVTHGFFAAPEYAAIGQGTPDDRFDPFRRTRLGGDPTINQYLPGTLSGLVLAGANNPAGPNDSDGILTASEIETLDLSGVQLAVLSACETGLGKTAAGEGLTGLQRAFHIAGARTVIASLWKVDDRATQTLMQRFYKNLWNTEREVSRLEALHEAQVWMLNNPLSRDMTTRRGEPRNRKPGVAGRPAQGGRTDPRYWAAFVLSGDWR